VQLQGLIQHFLLLLPRKRFEGSGKRSRERDFRKNTTNQSGKTPEKERSIMKHGYYSASLMLFRAIYGAAALLLFAAAPGLRAEDKARVPSLPSPLCDSLQVPDGNEVAFHAYAIGVQIYRWDGTSWVFVAPAAVLFADAGYHGRVGIHSAGPTWESNSGSKVVGTRLAGCTPDPDSIPWLKLSGASSGPGVLNGVTFVQRINTVGGKAPATAGTTVGQAAQVPYTAEYVFYRAAD
jgi:hypothetical protein